MTDKQTHKQMDDSVRNSSNNFVMEDKVIFPLTKSLEAYFKDYEKLKIKPI